MARVQRPRPLRYLLQHSPTRSGDQIRHSHYPMNRHSSLACNPPSLQTSSPASATPSRTVYAMHKHAKNSRKWHKHACKAPLHVEKNYCVAQVYSYAMRCALFRQKRLTPLPPPLRRRPHPRAQHHAERGCLRLLLFLLPLRRAEVPYFVRYVRTRRSCASILLERSARPCSSPRGWKQLGWRLLTTSHGASLSLVPMMGRCRVRARRWVSVVSRFLVVLLDDASLTLLGGHLVPEEMTEDEFWTRYFFRVHQIDQEEERRKAVLASK
jgi:BSD domain-containing protein